LGGGSRIFNPEFGRISTFRRQMGTYGGKRWHFDENNPKDLKFVGIPSSHTKRLQPIDLKKESEAEGVKKESASDPKETGSVKRGKIGG
jgi:hypothetical protein